jgi:hypothetical protein
MPPTSKLSKAGGLHKCLGDDHESNLGGRPTQRPREQQHEAMERLYRQSKENIVITK